MRRQALDPPTAPPSMQGRRSNGGGSDRGGGGSIRGDRHSNACKIPPSGAGVQVSRSGKVRKISTPSITIAMRNADSCAFQACDCHMVKYSPATTEKPKNQTPNPAVKPATAQAFA